MISSTDTTAPAYAGLVTRLIALLIDAAIVTVAVAVISLIGQTFLSFVSLDLNKCSHPKGMLWLQAYACDAVEVLGPAALLTLPPFYQLVFWVAAGQTPGMAICGIRIAPDEGDSMSLSSACVRLIGNWLSTAALGLGFLAILWDPKRRSWADKLARITVVYSSRAVLSRVSISLLALSLALGGAACATVPKQTPLMTTMKVKPTSRELRARVNDLAVQYAITMQQTADRVRAAYPDPIVQRATLRWKIDAVGMGSMAFFRADPLAAFLDGWLLTVQMRQFFQSEIGRATFKGAYQIAVDGCLRVEAEFMRSLRVMGTAERIESTPKSIEDWARAHPIQDLSLARESIEPFLATYTGGTSVGVVEAAGTLPETIDDMSHQMRFFMWFMPQQASTEAELMIEDSARKPEAQTLLRTMRAFGALAQELTAALQDAKASLGEEKQSVFDVLTGERNAVLDNIDAQRMSTLHDLQKERDIVLAAISHEREAAMRDFDKIAAKTVDRGLSRSYALIDHIFWRLAQFSLVAGLALLIAYLVLRNRHANAEPASVTNSPTQARC